MTPNALTPRPFGRTGTSVPPLGLGAGRIGRGDVSEAEVERLLHAALDEGVTLIDTAPSYGLSEERIGRHLSHRRGEFVLSTKGGYGVPGVPDWTGPVITAGIDAALQRLRTTWLDVFHLHSCPVETLERGEVIEALDAAVRAGKVRVAAYSGDGAPLGWAVRSGRFGSVMASINLCDQQVLERDLPEARSAGLGVIAKRPLANAAWRFAERPVGDYAEVYWARLKAMSLDPGDLAWDELALRFTVFEPGVSAAIVGTASVDHLRRAARLVERGPLPAERVEAVRRTAPGPLIATTRGVRGGGRAPGRRAGRPRGARRGSGRERAVDPGGGKGSGRGGPSLEGRRSGPDRGARGLGDDRSTSRRRVCDPPGVAAGVGEAYEAVREISSDTDASAGGLERHFELTGPPRHDPSRKFPRVLVRRTRLISDVGAAIDAATKASWAGPRLGSYATIRGVFQE